MEGVSRSLSYKTPASVFPLHSDSPSLLPLPKTAADAAACPCLFDMQADKQTILLEGAEGKKGGDRLASSNI